MPSNALPPGTLVPIKRTVSPFMINLVLRNHVMMSLHDVCKDLIAIEFPANTTPANWPTILKQVHAMQVAQAKFMLEYTAFNCTFQTKMAADGHEHNGRRVDTSGAPGHDAAGLQE